MADELQNYVEQKFAVLPELFLKALKLSPNAQGYLFGAITEFVLKDHLESKGYEVRRIKEKWEGDKHANHHGDFYIRRQGAKDWFVLESKGVKTNSEKWHKLYNKTNLVSFLDKYKRLTPFSSATQAEQYVAKHLPKFDNEYQDSFYTLHEIRSYTGTRASAKLDAITALRALSSDDYERLAVARTKYVRQAINVLETHLVSGGSAKSTRTQATPRIDEFHILSLDLFLRTGQHQFIFVNPLQLPPSTKDKMHLQQNYIVDILFKDLKGKPQAHPPWYLDIDQVFVGLTNPVREGDMQVDNRSIEEIAEEIAAAE